MNDERAEPSLTVDDYRRLADFRYALGVFLRFSEDAARAVGLTPNQHQLLLAVAGFSGDGDPSLSDLAERLGSKLHSMGELVGRAVEKGLVERSADERDHRRVLVRLTDRGAALLAELSVQHRRELASFRTEVDRILRDLEP